MMNSSPAISFRNPALVHKAGISALQKELGTVGAVYFLRQFSTGTGDYTAEREQLFHGITLDEIIESVRVIDAQKT